MKEIKKPKLIAKAGVITDKGMSADDYYRALENDVFARTLWGEARGEGDVGMHAVANVIMNRLAISDAHEGKYWWGNNIVEICQKPYQFSCWNRSDANYKKMRDLTDDVLYFITAQRMAARAAAGVLADKTGGATHYHAIGVEPFWAHGEAGICTIGHHVLYKL